MFPGTEENTFQKPGLEDVFFSVFFQTGKKLESDSDWKKGKKRAV